MIGNIDEDKFVIRYWCFKKKRKKKPYNQNEEMVRLTLDCSTQCQKIRADYQHYVKKMFACPL